MTALRIGECHDGVYWHGTAGNIEASQMGIHVGTYLAATEALEAAIGIPADLHPWDGTREYGNTLLAGRKTLERHGIFATGYSAGYAFGSGHVPHPDDDSYPSGRATFGDGTFVPLNARPVILAVRIIGPMLNARYSPKTDAQANTIIRAQLKRQRARHGYYYRNEAEDFGSISAVVPNHTYLQRLPDVIAPTKARPIEIAA